MGAPARLLYVPPSSDAGGTDMLAQGSAATVGWYYLLLLLNFCLPISATITSARVKPRSFIDPAAR